MRLWLARCSTPKEVEYIFAVDPDDRETSEVVNNPVAANAGLEAWADYVVVGNPGHGSAPAWDAAYHASSGELLIQVSDDWEPPVHWDRQLLDRLPPNWRNEPHVIAVNDGIRKDNLMTVFICTSEFANQQGEFLHAGFQSVFSDNDATTRAERAGCIINARDLLFQHRHFSAFPEVLRDATYDRQNSQDAYKRGHKLYMKRNFPPQ